jgi:hypothetical protein
MTASVCALMLSACPEEEAPYEEEDAGDRPHDIEACPDGVPETTIGMTVEGRNGILRAKLVEAEDLPAVKGFNTWTVEFTDADDEPVADAELVLDRSFGRMPAHPHDTNHDPVVESLGEGRFKIDQINLIMDGRWLLTLDPTSESAGDDSMTFELCTEASIEAAESHGDEH